MLRRTAACSLVLVVVVVTTSCTRLPRSGTPGEGGELAINTLRFTDSIPLEWGDLISVTRGSHPDHSLLWLQDEQGDIRVVGYNRITQRLSSGARVIGRRKGGDTDGTANESH